MKVKAVRTRLRTYPAYVQRIGYGKGKHEGQLCVQLRVYFRGNRIKPWDYNGNEKHTVFQDTVENFFGYCQYMKDALKAVCTPTHTTFRDAGRRILRSQTRSNECEKLISPGKCRVSSYVSSSSASTPAVAGQRASSSSSSSSTTGVGAGSSVPTPGSVPAAIVSTSPCILGSVSTRGRGSGTARSAKKKTANTVGENSRRTHSKKKCKTKRKSKSSTRGQKKKQSVSEKGAGGATKKMRKRKLERVPNIQSRSSLRASLETNASGKSSLGTGTPPKAKPGAKKKARPNVVTRPHERHMGIKVEVTRPDRLIGALEILAARLLQASMLPQSGESERQTDQFANLTKFLKSQSGGTAEQTYLTSGTAMAALNVMDTVALVNMKFASVKRKLQKRESEREKMGRGLAKHVATRGAERRELKRAWQQIAKHLQNLLLRPLPEVRDFELLPLLRSAFDQSTSTGRRIRDLVSSSTDRRASDEFKDQKFFALACIQICQL